MDVGDVDHAVRRLVRFNQLHKCIQIEGQVGCQSILIMRRQFIFEICSQWVVLGDSSSGKV